MPLGAKRLGWMILWSVIDGGRVVGIGGDLTADVGIVHAVCRIVGSDHSTTVVVCAAVVGTVVIRAVVNVNDAGNVVVTVLAVLFAYFKYTKKDIH